VIYGESPQGAPIDEETAIVYWLLPAKPERELFCTIIRIFCRELRAPNFEPHLTPVCWIEVAKHRRDSSSDGGRFGCAGNVAFRQIHKDALRSI
jgi:hypothetical protein